MTISDDEVRKEGGSDACGVDLGSSEWELS